MIGRLVRSADFERVLRTRSRLSSAHFALHYLADRPGRPAGRAAKPENDKLSTGEVSIDASPVDDCAPPAPGMLWLGAVVPKRHARRAVTRSLLKRQIRAVVDGHAAALAGGLWIVRLRAPFDKARFASAASDALKRVARAELEGLVGDAARRPPAGA